MNVTYYYRGQIQPTACVSKYSLIVTQHTHNLSITHGCNHVPETPKAKSQKHYHLALYKKLTHHCVRMNYMELTVLNYV